ncbi:MAG: hypothetical protein JWO46_1117 [Nocardioidaceae bacterium]|nr:hypothetical protein [Nocardioidaceae bacterium]
MVLSRERAIEAITGHSRSIAAAAPGHLRTRVQHCPQWNVGDLVWHVTEVHWFWRTVAGEALDAPPPEIRRPVRPPEDELLDTFLLGLDALTNVLLTADPATPCWTWYPPQQEVAFVIRHQVQEAVVHHFDAAFAAGQQVAIAPDVALDSVEEFLTVSLADAEDAARTSVELGDELSLHATDVDRAWTVRQDDDGALVWEPGASDPTVSGTAAQLLLWLYHRVDLPVSKPNLVSRFRKLSSTD